MMQRKSISLMLLLLLLVNSVAASSDAPEINLPTHCDDFVDGEVFVKYKTKPGKKTDFKYHHLKAKKHIKAKLHNFNVKKFDPALNLEGIFKKAKREVIPNAKMRKRQKEILALSLHEGLDDLYVTDLEPKPNLFFDWLDSVQGKLKESRCKKMLAMLEDLRTDPEVEFAEPNYKIKVKNFGADTASAQAQSLWKFDYDALWGISEIQANQVWQRTQGQGVVVAVIDTGVNFNHPDLWNSIWVNPSIVPDRNRDGRRTLSDLDTNFTGKLERSEIIPGSIGQHFFSNSDIPSDNIGHGTHVAGIIAAESGNSIGIAGAAPRVRIMPLRIFDSRAQTNTRFLIQALLYAARNGADVCNLSLTSPNYSSALAKVIKVVSKKMIVVAAAGNENRDVSAVNSRTIASPAGLPEVLSVGSMTNDRKKSSFSNFGFHVDFAAPGSASFGGANILSTDITGSGYKLRAGTSMATPYVTAAVALLKARKPGLKYDEAINLLRLHAKKIPGSKSLGAGLIQIADAFEASNKLPRVKLKVKEFQFPKLKSVSGAINIKGSVLGTDIVSYAISIGPGVDPSEFELIKNQPQRFMKKGLLLRGFETRSHKNGLYTLRLSATNSLGETVYDDALINIRN